MDGGDFIYNLSNLQRLSHCFLTLSCIKALGMQESQKIKFMRKQEGHRHTRNSHSFGSNIKMLVPSVVHHHIHYHQGENVDDAPWVLPSKMWIRAFRNRPQQLTLFFFCFSEYGLHVSSMATVHKLLPHDTFSTPPSSVRLFTSIRLQEGV
jgi:hypothetical protein